MKSYCNVLENKGKIILFIGILLLILLWNKFTVFGAVVGTGSSTNPYQVSTETQLKEAIAKTTRSGWTYIGITDRVDIKTGVTISSGKYRIFAMGDNRTIRRSTNFADKVNCNTKYCFNVSGTAEVNFGYSGQGFMLYLDGKAEEIGGGFVTKGVITVSESAKATLGRGCIIKNVSNLDEETEAGAVKSRGSLEVYGVVKTSTGRNGGGISIKAGSCTMYSSASVTECYSITEGGGIYVGGNATFLMKGGYVYGNHAREEGGGIFCTGGGCSAIIESGQIHSNGALGSAGGIFSGYQASLTLGTATTGPEIFNNGAVGSGGGVRCNGGEGAGSGGVTLINNASIHNNESGNLGGGIACGQNSFLTINNCSLIENVSFDNGGGISINSGVTNISGGAVNLFDCVITNNTAKNKGGGICADSPVLIRGNQINNNESDYGGGIYIGGNGIVHLWMGNFVVKNLARKSGGGIFIGTSATFVLSDKNIYENSCAVNGDGVCLKGKMEIFNIAYVHESNNVYLDTNTYITVTNKLLKESGYVAMIYSANTNVGTKIVQVAYEGKTGEDELYRTGNSQSEYTESCMKKFVVTNVKANFPLRPTNYVNDYDNNWIIISEMFTISYNKNTDDDVEQMPSDQIKFWHENIEISSQNPKRKGYQTTSYHWNTEKNGIGIVCRPKAIFKKDGDYILFAQWEKEKPTHLKISAKTRYYVVNQEIQLNMNEILKKVVVTDNLDTGKKYPVFIEKIRSNNSGICYERGKDSQLVSTTDDNVVLTEKFMNTDSENVYSISIFSYDKELNLRENETFSVLVVENKNYDPSIRFISKEYIWSINSQSKWNKELKGNLNDSLSKQSGEGMYYFYFSSEDIEEIKQKK